MKQNLVLFLCAIILAPALILLHESGHYFAARALGLKAEIRSSETSIHVPEPTPRYIQLLTVSGGPAMDALLAASGVVWLWCLRRNRLQSAATICDWLATFLATDGLRWLRCLTGTLTRPMPRDEATISQSLGLPPWLLAYALAPVGLALFILAVRLHPRGSRLAPFTSAFLGLILGAFVWVKILGPRILP